MATTASSWSWNARGRAASVQGRCQTGYPLFQYIDDNGERRTIDSGDIDEYLRDISGQDCAAKDFRTWAGTILAAYVLGKSFALYAVP